MTRPGPETCDVLIERLFAVKTAGINIIWFHSE